MAFPRQAALASDADLLGDDRLERVSRIAQDALIVIPQGLKPNDFLPLFGTTEVVP